MKTVELEPAAPTPDSLTSYPIHAAGAGPPSGREVVAARRRGRPIEMAPEELLARIGALASRDEGLFRAHRAYPALYARARRLFGSWEGAIRAAGLDYAELVTIARQRASRARRLTWSRGRRAR